MITLLLLICTLATIGGCLFLMKIDIKNMKQDISDLERDIDRLKYKKEEED